MCPCATARRDARLRSRRGGAQVEHVVPLRQILDATSCGRFEPDARRHPAPNLVFRRPMPTHGGRLPRRGSKQPPWPPRPHIDTLSARPNGAACRKVDPLTTRHVWTNLSAVEVPVDASRDQPLLLRHELKRLLSWSQRPFKCMNSLHFRRREYAGAWT